jgi:putative ABC transport system ATP-binding protein
MALAAMRGKLRLPLPFSRTSRRCAFRDRLATLSLGLEDRLDEPVRNLSGGQRQALSLLMAVLCDCEVLLLDEITAALDPQGANRLMGLVNRTVRESGRTCLMVTHNMQQAIDYGNRLVVLKHGSIASQFYGKEKDNLSAANLYAQFED